MFMRDLRATRIKYYTDVATMNSSKNNDHLGIRPSSSGK